MTAVRLRLGPLFIVGMTALFLLPSGVTLATKGPDLEPGTSFRECQDCPEMVVIPRGTFVMGSRETKAEQPPRIVMIKKPFAIGKFEVTFAEWEACVKERGCDSRMPSDHGWGKVDMPVINVNFKMVEEYARWLSIKTGKTYRLPSEAEWEYAARGGSTTRFWFGDDPGKGQVNCRDCSTKWSKKGSAPVGSFKANPFGLHDMHGNAYEWVADCWNPNYQGAPKDARSRTDGDCTKRVIRGGSWYYFQRQARSSSRAKNAPNVKSYWLSFRLVREID